MATYLLGLGAAVCFGVAAVIQQRVAFRAPPGDVLRLRLLLWLVRRPLWDLGVAIGGLGSLLAAAALTHGAVALVEPLQICQLLFALPLAALLARRVVPRRDWLSAAATAIGLALFVCAGKPDSGDARAATTVGWVTTGVVVGLLVFWAVWGTRRLAAVRRAPLLAAAAGLLSALQAAIVSGAGHLLTAQGADALARSWFPWAVAAAAVISAVLAQSAYEMAPLPASLPASVSVEPLAGVVIGVTLLGGGLRLAPLAIVAEIIGLVVMTVGVRTLARSPLITGQLSRLAARQAQGRLSRLEEQVHHDLERLRHDLRASRRTGPANPAIRRLRKRLSRDLDRIGEELASLADERDRFEQQLRSQPPVEVAPAVATRAVGPGLPARGAAATRSVQAEGDSVPATAVAAVTTVKAVRRDGSVRGRRLARGGLARLPRAPGHQMAGVSSGAGAAYGAGAGAGAGAGVGGGSGRSGGAACGDLPTQPLRRGRARTVLGDDLVPVDGLLAARRELDARAEDLRRQADRLRRATRRILAQHGTA
ncbi:Multidrug transporter [Frankia canadensis]|uniref:Multidrug transporter n=1 Tax=Frankia canadensis TaxID=1836972 RepID=A0A2I2KR61_9ACTN|nr:DMT family transporter [Frankia canadensis]SNQ48154.1 Multidrug transporter [Frankia canadensis]SOU55444.1 Multidrug transporter [Frankia canadensis]